MTSGYSLHSLPSCQCSAPLYGPVQLSRLPPRAFTATSTTALKNVDKVSFFELNGATGGPSRVAAVKYWPAAAPPPLV